MSPRRSRSIGRSAFAGGFLGGFAWGVVRRVPWKALLALGLFALLAVKAAWDTASPGQKALVVVAGVSLLVLWLWYRRQPAARRAPVDPVWLPRTTGDMFWVYVLREWRDNEDRIIPLRDLAAHPERVLHLVYVGYSQDIEQRLRRHAADKTWFHDDLFLDPRTHWYASEEEARQVESWLINEAAQSGYWQDWPRENWVGNPRREECRELSERMRARAFAA